MVTADDLARIGTRVPAFYAGDLFCPVGRTPLYLGQPIALLIFEDFDSFDQARLALRDQAFARFGEETGPVEMPNYGAFRFTRVAGPTPEVNDVYSPVKNGWPVPASSSSTARNAGADLARLPVPIGAAYAEAADIGEGYAQSWRRTIRRSWCWSVNSTPSRSIRCFSSRKAA
jgi:hypothetical protein